MNRQTFIVAGSATLVTRPADAATRSVPRFVFYSDFRMNLHHALYRQSGILQTVYDGGVGLLDPLRRRIYDEITSFQGSDRDAWYRALAFYTTNYDYRSLVFDDGMVRLDNNLPFGVVPKDLAFVLDSVAPIYRRTLWPAHDASNRRRIATVRRNLAVFGVPLFPKLGRLLQTPWLSQTYRVDVVASTDRDGAYSNGDDSGRFWHIFLSSYDREDDGLSGFETLAHEAAHSIVDPVHGTLGRAIQSSARKLGRPVPDDLWHVVIMYLPGAILAQLVAARGGGSYTSTFYTGGLFTHIYPRYYAALVRHVGPYVAGTGTLDGAILAAVRDIVA